VIHAYRSGAAAFRELLEDVDDDRVDGGANTAEVTARGTRFSGPEG
jgi:hypothetical protein